MKRYLIVSLLLALPLASLCLAQGMSTGTGGGRSEKGSSEAGGNESNSNGGNNAGNDRVGHEGNSDRTSQSTGNNNSPAATAREPPGSRMLDQMADNPDFGNIEGGDPQTFGKAADWVRDRVNQWDSNRSFLENLGLKKTEKQ